MTEPEDVVSDLPDFDEVSLAEMTEKLDEDTERRIGLTGKQTLLVAASFNSAI